MKTKIHHLISVVTAVAMAAGSTVFAAEPVLVSPPVKDGGVKAVYEFYDDAGLLNLAYERSYPDKPSDFFYVTYDAGKWSTPYIIPVSHQNSRALRGVVNLVDTVNNKNTPLLLLNSDNTDYGKLFNITGPDGLDTNGVPKGSGLTPEQFRAMLINGQRLFYIMQIGKNWSTPMPIPQSTMVTQAVITAGTDGTALVLFARDGDKNGDTVNDSELYATVYANHLWSTPVRVTNNSLPEHGLQVTYVNGRYVVAWVTDKDGNLQDRSDSELGYAAISTSGNVAMPAATVVADLQNNPAPVLGTIGNEAVLLWTSTTAPDATTRNIFESRFSTSWTAPVDTGLQVDYLLGGKVSNTTSGPILIFKDKAIAQASLNIGGTWKPPAGLIAIDGTGFEYEDYWLFIDRDSNLWSAGAANVATNNQTAGTGLYVWHELIGQDLAMGLVMDQPHRKQLGKQAKLVWAVTNIGVLPSATYRAEIYRDGGLMGEVQGTALEPGARQSHEYPFTLDRIQVPFEVRLVSVPEDPVSNNSATRVVEVRPDFDVRSVTHSDVTHFTADIIERKGVSAPPVPVSFYLVDNGQLNLIAKGEFDTNSGMPLTVQTEQLVDRMDPYQILVKVNEKRSVKEDNYSNNQSSFIYKPQPDFEIAQFYLTETDVHVSVRNAGNQTASSVDVLLTDDPLIATQNTPGTTTPWDYQQVTLDTSGQAQLTIPLASKAAFTGERLYAVVNPHGTFVESDRNNNTKKIPTNLTATNGGGGTPGTPGPLEPILAMSHINPWCSTLQVDVNNSGTAPAIASRMELVDTAGYLVASQTLPVVMPATTETVTLQNLASGNYTVRITYNTGNGDQTAQRQASINPAAMCSTVAEQDVRIVSLQPTQTPSQLQVVVNVAAIGYQLDYRKPLIRVPVELEVKQGITTISNVQQAVYLGGGAIEDASQTTFSVSLANAPAGALQLTATIPVRDDERDAVNNIQFMELAGGTN